MVTAGAAIRTSTTNHLPLPALRRGVFIFGDPSRFNFLTWNYTDHTLVDKKWKFVANGLRAN